MSRNQGNFWRLGLSSGLILSLMACSGDQAAEPAARQVRQAVNFAGLEWIPLVQGDNEMGDPDTDGANNGREVVGGPGFPAVYVATDGVDFALRLRVDEDPRSGAKMRAFGWGVLIDTDGSFAAYEYSFMIDGTGNPQRIVFAHNSSPGVTGTPQDVAETELYEAPLDFSANGNVQVTVINPGNFGGDPDYFIDMAMPLSELLAVGISLSTPVSFIAGTSSSANSLSVDLAAAATTGNGTLATAASDPTMLDGSDADPDGDSVLAPDDADNDNDGVPDTLENGYGTDPDGDADGDGVPNWQDASDRGDGFAANCLDLDADQRCDTTDPAFDFDGDGVPNHNDLDSDNDGIPDVIEAGHGASDPDGDGMLDGTVGTNGLDDAVETAPDSGVVSYVLLNTDGLGQPDLRDLDSDEDGAFDLHEIGQAALDGATLDGQIETDTTDADRDGILAPADGDEDAYGFPAFDVSGLDPDSDGIPGPYDPDESPGSNSDSEGGDDATECPGGWPCPDADGDGVPDYNDGTVNVDADGDGVDNGTDIDDSDPNVCRDVDADGCDDCTNTGADASGGDPTDDGTDSDADSICDVTDACFGVNSSGNNDGDGECNDVDADDDNDGALDADDSDDADPTVCSDSDVDGCEDCSSGAFDLANDGTDTDSDGICDVTDACLGDNSSGNNDGDGECNDVDADDDDDGALDADDSDDADPTVCSDSDGDGCEDCSSGAFDLANDGTDSDSDGICDATDSCVGDNTSGNNDGDGQCDDVDTDDDNDGVPDADDDARLDPNVCRDTD